MLKQFVRITAIILFIATCMFLPHFPGDYDRSAATLSTMAQLFATSGLLFVPIGVVWLIYETRRIRVGNWKGWNKSSQFGNATLVALGVVALITSLGAFVNNSFSLAIISLFVFIYMIVNFARKLREMKSSLQGRLNPIPLYLVFIPIVLVFLRFIFITPATKFSRTRAIRQSERLISDIEAYYDKYGYYPKSLLSVWEDYKPSVIGINRYHYELNGAAYNLYFEQFSNELSVKEIVMYNKLDEHVMTSHNQDLLVRTPQELNMRRGYFSTTELPIPHWKYFWFD